MDNGLKLIELIGSGWRRQRGASEQSIANAEARLGVVFPPDYRRFLRWSEGGEGHVGDEYLSLWDLGDILADSNGLDYQVATSMPGIVPIGTDGGGEAYGLDYRKDQTKPHLIRVGLGVLDFDEMIVLGPTLCDWAEGCLRIMWSERHGSWTRRHSRTVERLLQFFTDRASDRKRRCLRPPSVGGWHVLTAEWLEGIEAAEQYADHEIRATISLASEVGCTAMPERTSVQFEPPNIPCWTPFARM